MTVDSLANQVVRAVAELPDRTSPDDMPDMLMVTVQELHDIVAATYAAEKEGLRKALEGVLAAVANITKIDPATSKNLCELPLDTDEVIAAWNALNAAVRNARSKLEGR